MNPYETGRITDVDPSAVTTRDEFGSFVFDVLTDLRERGGHEEWENSTLDGFLEALSAVSDARFVDQPVEAQEEATWRNFATLIVVATGYE